MCYFEVQLNLHCGHATLIPQGCALNALAEISDDGNSVCVASKDVVFCGNHGFPDVHSFLTCCEYCHGMLHSITTTSTAVDDM